MSHVNANKFRIALLLPDLQGGGAERITVNLANNLVSRGYIVDMVLLSATGPFLELLHPSICVVNLKVDRIRGLLIPLIRYLRRTKPDAMIAAMWPLTVIAVIARKFASVSTRLVLAEHNTWSKSQVEYSYLQRIVIKSSMSIFFPHAEGVVAVSNGAADDFSSFAKLERKKITTIYNPVIDSSVAQFDEKLISGIGSWTNSKFRILTVGTLKKQKNHALLIDAFCIVRKRFDAHLLILGEGGLRKELEAQIDDLGIKDYVSMPGFVNNPGVYYHHTHLFALSSGWEGLPTVLIEALAAKTPIVSTDCPSGPREILCNGQFGRLVPVDDAPALADAMKKSLAEHHDTAALMARAQDFSINKAVDAYEKLLRGC